MKRNNEQSLKQALEGFVQDYGLRAKLDEQAVREFWPEIAGAMIARHTMELRLRRGVLSVKVDSAPLREELTYMREAIKGSFNSRLEREVVLDIKIG
jgi:predicted nucleic acid-binding Zn ribbon protein